MRHWSAACRQRFISFLFLLFMLTSCVFPTLVGDQPSQIPPLTGIETPNGIGSASDAIQVYFTDPTAPRAKDYKGGPDEILAAAIDQARLTVDVAAYNFNLWSIRNALIRAYKRGVVVRIVMESDNMDSREVQEIDDAGIPVVGDQHEGLMHNKFVVIDHSEIWTGSMNFSVGGAYKDNNNLVRIHSVKLAEKYTGEFEEMFGDHLFGPDVLTDIPDTGLEIDGIPVEILFSPDDRVAARIIELVQDAQESIYFMAFNFTSNDIGSTITLQAQSGLSVVGVMDADQVISSQGTEYDQFRQAAMNVRLDGNEPGLMHHKVIIIDHQIVITGSYNFTASAEENNDENVVIIFSPNVAARFEEEFQRVHDLAQPLSDPTQPLSDQDQPLFDQEQPLPGEPTEEMP
jgi:phosphatidylserine/phosphatidylglycerophosphate/cardiolipin synthase-like enzyme